MITKIVIEIDSENNRITTFLSFDNDNKWMIPCNVSSALLNDTVALISCCESSISEAYESYLLNRTKGNNKKWCLNKDK